MTTTPQDPKLDLYNEHKEDVLNLQSDLLQNVLPRLVGELSLSETQEYRLGTFLSDTVTIFRFYRKANFDYDAGRDRLEKTLRWRFDSAIDEGRNGEDMMPTNVFEYVPGMEDNYGRTCNVLHLSRVQRRTTDNSLDGLREYLTCVWESSRRRMQQISEDTGTVRIQMVLLVDLADATMGNMEIELLPYMADLLKSHFPGMVGAIFIINYTWLYAGMWALAKRIMPQTVLERIEFPTTKELQTHFPVDKLAREYGGSLQDSLEPVTLRTDVEQSPTTQPSSATLEPERPQTDRQGYLSPYNPRNPYYGYEYGHGHPGRRRKRDLLRTLMYLFSLRLLAVRRHMQRWGWIWMLVGAAAMVGARRIKKPVAKT